MSDVAQVNAATDLGLPLPYARRPVSPGPVRWRRHPRDLDVGRDLDVRAAAAAVLATYGEAGGGATAAAPLVRTAVVCREDEDGPPAPPDGCGLVIDHATTHAKSVVRAWYDPGYLEPAGIERVLDDLDRALSESGEAGPARVSRAVGADRLFTADHTVLAAVERHARDTPDAVAVLSGEARLTYGELDRRAAALAGRLQTLGAGPETHVVLLLAPSVDLAVAALATFKAGAAFVPVDPEYPDQRVRELIAAVPDAVTVTTAAFESALPPGRPRVLADEAGDSPDGPLPVRTAPESAACALFTSASTGSSKAVVITHRGLLNLAHCAIERLGLTAADRFLQLASPSFSAFLEEAFPSLVAGGSLVLAGYRHGMPSAPGLVANLARYEATAFGITTAHWHHLVDHLTETGTALPPSVRLALMGSERALPDKVAAWCAGGVPMVHVYGPTEATATATYFLLDVRPGEPARSDLPIGKVIPNTRLYLCDSELRLVPHGVPGEVYLGGVSLARGYLGAPGVTADRFVPDPFGPSGGRLYRTGDLARFLPDGNLEFLSRDVSLIKVHGCRVNPAEVEAALERHPAVAKAAVLADRDAHGDDRLAAYVVAEPGRVLDRAAVRSFLADRVPSFMVPAVLAEVAAFPLNANGKTDRAALGRVGGNGVAGNGAPYLAPHTATQRVVADVWASVLGSDRVGLADDFFELGGDSLQVLRVASELRRRLGVDLALPEIFGAPTVGRLSELVDARAGDRTVAAIDAERLRSRRWLISRTVAERTGIPDAVPLALSQQGLWFVTRVHRQGALYTTAWRCRISGALDLDAIRTAANAVLDRHEALRSRFTVAGGQALQVVGERDGEALTVVAPPGADPVARRAAVDATCAAIAGDGVDTDDPSLCRFVLFPITEDEHVLLTVVHHLVCDHRSEAIMLRDLAAEYTACRTGTAADLPPLPIGYRDFAVWQRAQLQRGDGLRQLEYWRDRLSDLSTVDLPYDEPRTPDHDFAGDSIAAAFTPAQHEAVRRVAAACSVTPFIVLLTAFFVLLHRRSGATDLCVGSPFANRTRPELEPMVGYFVNMVGLRLDLGGEPSFSDLLERVRGTTLEAYEHQELPFHLAVREVGGHERRPGATPLFSAAFTLDDDPAAGVAAPGLTFGPVRDVPTGKVGLDLVFLLVNRPSGVDLTVDFSTRLFRPETVHGMVEDYLSIIDRVAADPAATLSDLVREDRVPLTEAMRRLWAAAFHVDHIGADDDFFEMGGSSLLAAQIVAGLGELLGVDVTLRMFFESATIRELADRITAEYSITTVAPDRLAALGSLGSIDDLVAGVHELSDDELDRAVGGRAAGDDSRGEVR